MAKIIQLSEQTVAKIAAGEVIERPVYAVKELVENAIDAGAQSIIVHIEQSGLRKITVIDDGEGMNRQDLELCFKPHTTSKLRDEEMLHAIGTLGFRGEAISSIAAISTLSISSRTKNESIGTNVLIYNGVVATISPVGLPVGTHVTVENLFGSVPARKKFLKTERTEFRQITELLTQYSLSYPSIRFVLIHNGKTIFDLIKTDSIYERIYLLFGKDMFSSLLQTKYQDSYTAITGYIARPQATTQTGQKQYIFVNNRRVNDKLIAQAVKDAFGGMLEATSYPVFVLFLALPYELVDVNVHPRKEQVRFVHSQLVYDAVRKAVGEVLANNNITFQTSLWGAEVEDSLPTKKGTTNSYAGQLLKETVLPWDVRSIDKIATSDIVQIHNLYLLTATTHGFVLIDQHAAHERILYEQFGQAFAKQKKKNEIFHLAKPLRLEVSLTEAEIIEEHLETLTNFGFSFEHFGGTTYLVSSVPMLLRDRDIKQLIGELLEDLSSEKGEKSIDKISGRMLAYLACRAAVMAGEKLNKKQMRELIEKLEQTPNNATCPHGRPTKIAISLERLHRLFKRK